MKSSEIRFFAKDVSYFDLPSEVRGENVNYINFYDKAYRRKLRKGIVVFWIKLLRLKGNLIEIPIVEYYATYKKGEYVFSNYGGSISKFTYDNKSDEWKYIETVEVGI